jgi:flagellar assembly factor FliW
MPRLVSQYFGELDYSPEAVFQFPEGIPAFEDQTAFVFLEQARAHPLVFMQSLDNPGLCFITVPVFVVDTGYHLDPAPEDLASLELAPELAPQIGLEILCLALVTVSKGADPTVNLLSPIVLNLRNRKGRQVIQPSAGYSIRHPLLAREDLVACS